ncbi:MAG: hypothetical protein DRP58_07945 [Spirochaetes bacterium]|nr:MAG: hypothetical protein DRP58_07945 [Spirochaetota bacterium]
MDYSINENDVPWTPHPTGLDGVEMKKLRSKENGTFQESIALVKIERGALVPSHIHQKEDDNLYILAGSGKMKVADKLYELKKGVQITVPAGIQHEIFDITEELLIYDVFAPGTF